MLLNVKDITVHYDSVAALKGISLEVQESEIVTIIGANGAGKTTALRAISGLNRLTSGEILYRGQRIDKLSPPNIVKQGIAQVPEGRKLFPQMTVLDNLLMGAFLRKDKEGIKQDLESIFHHFPVLKARTGQFAGTLSGGEQQMLAMGRALMSHPALLLLDEPSLGLAPFMVAEIAKIIQNVNQEGVSIILVEQNARLALRLANTGYVLETGRIVLQGKGEDLLNNEEVKKAYLGG